MNTRYYFVQKFALTRTPQESKHLKDREYERRVTHERRERRDEPIEVLGRYHTCPGDAVCASGQQALQFTKEFSG